MISVKRVIFGVWVGVFVLTVGLIGISHADNWDFKKIKAIETLLELIKVDKENSGFKSVSYREEGLQERYDAFAIDMIVEARQARTIDEAAYWTGRLLFIALKASSAIQAQMPEVIAYTQSVLDKQISRYKKYGSSLKDRNRMWKILNEGALASGFDRVWLEEKLDVLLSLGPLGSPGKGGPGFE